MPTARFISDTWQAFMFLPTFYVRYLRLKKEDVIFIGGSDEHGVPITIRAKKEGITRKTWWTAIIHL